MIVIAAADPDEADAALLIDEMSDLLAILTGAGGKASFDTRDVRAPRALFVIARDGAGQLLGCAGLRPLDGETAELKRMYARPGTRGVGAALLAHIEARAAAFGYRALQLETRRINTRAVAFYHKHGYRPIDNYGKYVGVAHAICLAKALGAAGPD
ncbi:GNAT superfamily N-acetyltransferase [Oxalobacteraceae bacterium GrIS 1.11]